MKIRILYFKALLFAVLVALTSCAEKTDEVRVSYKNAYKVNSVCEICDIDSLNTYKDNIEKLGAKHNADLIFNGKGQLISVKNIQPSFKSLEIKNPTDRAEVKAFYGKKLDLLCSSYDLTLSLALYHLKLSNFKRAEKYLIVALGQEAALSQILDYEKLFACHYSYTPRLISVIAQFCIYNENYIDEFILTPEWRNLSERNCDKEFAKYLNVRFVNSLHLFEELGEKKLYDNNLRELFKVLNTKTQFPEIVTLSEARKFAQNQEPYIKNLSGDYWIYLRTYSQLNVLKVLINASKEKLASGSYPKTTSKKFSSIIDSRGVKIHYSFTSEVPHICYSLKGTLYGQYVNSLGLTSKPKEFWQLEALQIIRKRREQKKQSSP